MTGADMQCDLPYVNGYRDRHGRQRYYFRRKGFPRVALPGLPGSPEFLAAYQAANSTPGLQPVSKTANGTIGALVLEYQGSAEFAQLAASWRREMGYVLNGIVRDDGSKPAGKLEKRHLLKQRDALKHKPGAANKKMRVWAALGKFGHERGHMSANPAAGIKMLKLGRWRAWTDEEHTLYEERWPLGTLQRIAYDIALYSIQRSADQLKIRWDKIAGKTTPLKQSKTGKTRHMPLHERLLESLAAWRGKRPGATVICKANGEPYSERYFRELTASAIAAAGLPEDCVWHGLKKSAARQIAEAGGNSMPLSGHKTEAMRREYEADADQAKLANAEIIKWEKASRAKGRIENLPNPRSTVTNRKRKTALSP
jgi:integrase